MKKFGYSLMEVLVALGAMSFVSLTLMRLSQQSSKVAKTGKTNAEITNMEYQVQNILGNDAGCQNTFIPSGTPTISLPAASIDLTNVIDAGGRNLISVGSNIGAQQEATVTRIWIDASAFPTPDASYGASGTVDLYITYQKNGEQYGGTTVTKSTRIQLATNTSGLVSSCHSDESQAVENARKFFCEEDLGGSWNEALNPKCRDPVNYGPLIQ